MEFQPVVLLSWLGLLSVWMGPAWSFLPCVLSHGVATLGASEGFRETAFYGLLLGSGLYYGWWGLS